MATTRRYSSPKTTSPTYNHTHTHAPTSISSPLASGSKSTLPLPKAIRENRSFVNLARLLGLANGHGDESRDGDHSGDGLDGGIEEEGDDDGDGSEIVDEESLMWDAQVCHHDSLLRNSFLPSDWYLEFEPRLTRDRPLLSRTNQL